MTTATLTITRAVNVPKFYDAAGVAETEAEDVDIEVTLSGTYQPAEPDVGIMSPGFIDIYAEDEDGNEIELTTREQDLAQEVLLQASVEDAEEARSRGDECRADVNRELAESLNRAENSAAQYYRDIWE